MKQQEIAAVRTQSRVFVVDENLPDQWPDHTFLTSPTWLKMMGDRPPGRGYFFRLVQDGITVAATTGYLIDDPDSYESFNIHDLLWRDPPVFPDQERPLSRGPERATVFPFLAFVQPGYDCEVAVRAPFAEEAVRALLAEVTRWAHRAGAVCAAVLYAAGSALPATLDADAAWHRRRGTVRSMLDVPAGGFDDYVSGLPKTSRQKVRWDLRDLARAGVRTVRADTAGLGATEVRLRMNLIAKYGGYSTWDVERSRLERLVSLFPADSLRLFHCVTGAGDVVGFSLFIAYADQWHVFWCGFDYENSASRRTYFDAMFYSPVRVAQTEEVRVIDYGLGYEKSKKWRGCHGVRRDIWVSDLGGDLAPWWQPTEAIAGRRETRL
ncbi:GNAT family N-acetyltransferase [Streptomyces pacificus]|uniref:GNAT family N-acetyltransferase n=1 Tax=Streptomyces pacificus TaxID=2705029 RepID=A0A6A0B2L7_9ACTN|nr:GNAT family N-acetyltransferase [Streptomyces pacificus]GFH38983.1 GNAT family N-acetyltransferase [Streptomyces pacificus]